MRRRFQMCDETQKWESIHRVEEDLFEERKKHTDLTAKRADCLRRLEITQRQLAEQMQEMQEITKHELACQRKAERLNRTFAMFVGCLKPQTQETREGAT